MPDVRRRTVTGMAGNLEQLPADLRSTIRLRASPVVRTLRTETQQDRVVRAIARRMPNGNVLVIGRNVDEASEISHVVGQALALGPVAGAFAFACWPARG